MSDLKVFVLGAPQVELDHESITIHRRKALALLVYLAVTGARQRRDTLAALLWPDSSQRRARAGLRRDLSELNLALGNQWLDLDREHVALRPGYWLDVDQFQADLDACAAAPAICPERLTAAVARYRADFLAGFTLKDCPQFDEWQFLEAESLRQLCAEALDRLIDLLSGRYEYENAIVHARRRITLDPLYEPAHRRLMRLFVQAGRQAAALRQYDHCRAILDAELGVPPAPETTELHARIRARQIDSTRNKVQLAATQIGVRHNLPVQTTSFIGRMAELRDLACLLADPGVRLITIFAPGGMGKTRLAIEIAAQSLESFPDGVYFVSLAQIGSSDDLITVIGREFGLAFLGAGNPKQQLLDFLRSQTLLLVLDNFEHLLAGAPLVAKITEAAPGIKVLLTSREKLNLSSETVYALEGMSVPQNVTDPLSFDAVRLFVVHAHRVWRNFSPDDPLNIVRIVQLTQGMPLGIVLAAAWADMLSPRQIADEISRGLDVLQQEIHDFPVRHRSIRAVFDPTWEWLTEAQREVFMKLSVFRGGFTREAAQAVTGADLRMLSVLVDKSLIQSQPNSRYAVHELLRQYGECHLYESGASHAAYAAHSAFFMAFLAQREEDVKGRRQIAALHEIDQDFENIRSAWLWSIAHEEFGALDHALECLVIAGEATGRLLETQSMLQQSADRLTGNEQDLWARIVVRLARLDNALRNDANVERVEVILERARARNDVAEVAWCLWVLADREAIINGRDHRALPLYEELIALCHATGNDYVCAHGLTGVSWRYANKGEVTRAVTSLRACIAIRQKIGDVRNLDYVTAQLSWMTFDLLQKAKTAEALLDEQIAVQNEMGTTSLLPLMLGVKAMMTFWRNDLDSALLLAQRGLDVSGSQNYFGGKSVCQGVQGMVKCYSGDYKQAQILCGEVASLGFANLTAFPSYWVLSLAAHSLDDETGSRRSFTAAVQIACRYKSPTFQAMCLLLATVMYLVKHDPQRAVEYLAFCFSQPPHLIGWLHKWTLLHEAQAHLHSQFDRDTYSAAWLRGQTLDLNTEAARALSELQTQKQL